MTTLSKTQEIEQNLMGRGLRHVSSVIQALDAHRKSNKWSYLHQAESICIKLHDVSKENVAHALKVYLKAKKRDRLPHPNYFVTVALNHVFGENKKVDGHEVEGDNSKPLIIGRAI